MAESPQERSPGVFSRIGSWLSWGWVSPPPGGDAPSSETQQHSRQEDDRETERDECSPVEVTHHTPVPSLNRNAKYLRSAGGGRSRGHTSQEEDSDSESYTRTEPPQVTSDLTDRHDTDQMGRRRSGKKRRSSQGDGGGAKTTSPTMSQPSSPAITSLARSPEPAWAESAFEEAPKTVPEFPREEPPNSPEAGRHEYITEWTEAHPSDTAEPLGRAVVTDSDMDEETVVRLTETPESKRRSVKVSHSEKFFAKKVVVTSTSHTEDQHEMFKEARDTTDHELTKAEDRARCSQNRPDGPVLLNAIPHVGRITDKISLFENQTNNTSKSNFTNPRRLDIPAGNVARHRQFTEPAGAKSGSVPSNLSVKDRVLNFSADRREDKKFTPPSVTSGVSNRTLNDGHLKTETSQFTKRFERSAAKAGTGGEKPGVKPKPPLNTDQTDSKSHNATESASNVGNKEVSSPIDETQQIKSPTRTGSRSKKRRSKDAVQPLSPTSKNKQEVGQDKQEVKNIESSSVPDMSSKPLTGAKTTDKCSDKLTTNSTRVPKEKPEELIRAAENTPETDPKRLKTPRTDEKSHKEKYEKGVTPTSETSQPSPAPASQTKSSSSEDQTEPEERRTNNTVHMSLKNRHTIVKPDPSVTNEEKPPAPEDLKEASSKYPSEPANSSSGKDVRRNRESEMDFKVLPAKDTATARGTSECVLKSNEEQTQTDDNKDDMTKTIHQNTTETLKNNNTGMKTKTSKPNKTSFISTRQRKRTETTEKEISTDLTNESNENILQSNTENLTLISPNVKNTSSANEIFTKQPVETPTKPTSTNETASSLPASSNEKAKPPPASTDKKTTPPLTSSDEKTTPPLTSSDEKTTPPLTSSDEKTTPPPTSSDEKTTPPPASTDKKTTPPPASTDKKTAPPPASTNEKTTPPLTSSDEKTTPPPASTDEKTTPPLTSSDEKTTPPPTSSDEKTTPPPASTDKKTTPPPASTDKKTAPPPASTNEKTTPPLTSSDEKTTPPLTSSDEKTTPPLTSSDEKTTPPLTSSDEKTTPPLTSSDEKTTPPLTSSDEKTTPPPASTDEKTTPPPASTDKKTAPPPASTNEKTTPPLTSSDEKTTPPPASTDKKTTPPLTSSDEKTTPPLTSSDEKTTPPLTSSDEKTTPPPASTDKKTTPPPASTDEKTTPPLTSSDEKTTPPPASTDKKTTPPPASTESKTTPPLTSTDKKTTPPLTSSDEKTTPPPASTESKTTPPPASTDEKTTPPLTSSDEKTTPPPASTNEKTTPPASVNVKTTPSPVSTEAKTTPPPASSDEKTTPPLTSSDEKTTPPLTSSDEKTTPPLTSSDEKTTPPPASTDKKTTPPLTSSDEKTTPPLTSSDEKTTPPPASTDKKTTPPPASTDKKTVPPPASTDEKTTPPLTSSDEKTTPPPASTDEKTTPPLTSSDEKTTPPPASTNEKTTPPASVNVKTTPSPVSTEAKTTPPPASSDEKTTPPASVNVKTTPPASANEKTTPPAASTEKKTTPTSASKKTATSTPVSSDEKATPPQKSPSPVSVMKPQSSDPATRKKEFVIKPLFLPQIPSSPGRQSVNRDSVSSWLDVERPVRKKQAITDAKPKLSSSVSESSLLEASRDFDPDDFISNVKGRAMPFTLPQRKHKQHRLQAPPFIMPPIREDRNEKPFDPEEFQHGLRKRREFTLDLIPSKSQDSEEDKPKRVNPERESILTRSVLFKRAKMEEMGVEKEKESGESKTEASKVRSRLERCSILSSLRNPTKTRRQEFLSPTESPTDVLLSPSDAPESPSSSVESPKPATSSTQTDRQVHLKPADPTPNLKLPSADLKPPHPSDVPTGFQPNLQSDNNGPAVTSDHRMSSADAAVTMATKPPPPSGVPTGFQVNLQPYGNGPAVTPDPKTTSANPVVAMATDVDTRLPGYLEKILPKGPEASVSRESASGPVGLNKAVDVQTTDNNVPVIPTADIPAARGFHRRPGKIVIYQQHQFSGQSFDFYRDEHDVTHLQLSSVISVKVIRGCWILFEKAGFEGRCIALEEEEIVELPNEWAEEAGQTPVPFVIGSLRLSVRDYTPPRIELFSEAAGRGRSSEFVGDTDEVGAFGLPQNTSSIKVHSGLWLVYSDAGFQGLLAVLERGEYPCPESWGFPVPAVGSLRALRMGSVKVQHPNAVKAVLYEKAGLQGRCVEVQGDVFSFRGTDGEPDGHGLSSVASLKILRGLWVGCDQDGFEGHQFVLEEGQYLDWRDWGGTGQNLLSLRPVLTDFSSPHMKMFSDLDFSERGVNVDLLEPLENTANTEYGAQTRSIDVLSGAWVVFDDPGFCGQHYVLEKGLYSSPEDWGSSNSRILSVIPVMLENQTSSHFKIQLFSEHEFCGPSVLVEDTLPTMPQGFIMSSCRVHTGSWLAFGRESCSGSQCVLEEGDYPDLRMLGFTQPNTSVLSLQPVGHEFSLPSIVLFERSGFRGRRSVLKSSSVNLQLTESCTRVSSILVEGGIWVLYESNNFRGSQFLLKPGEVPDWPKLSTWSRIGSLRPLIQKQAHFRLRSEEAGLMMSMVGSLGELMRIQATEETGGVEHIWIYQDGHLQSKMLAGCFVDVSSGVLMAGSRAVLSSDPDKPHQLWNITSDGLIRNHAAPNLVLEVKGGQQFDKNQIILNEFHPNKLNQRWSLELL